MIDLIVSMLDSAPSAIVIPGESLFTESLTSTADGTVFIGSIGGRTIFRAKPGAATAEVWIEPATDGLRGIFGVFADEKSNTLWACTHTLTPPGTPPPPQSTLHAFDLKTGAPKAKWPLPTAGAFCNDIAVGADGTTYATDSNNMEIVRLTPGAKALQVWAGNGAFGPKGGILDGIAVVEGKVIVNVLNTGRLFSVPINGDGNAGAVVEVKLDRAIARPDGQRSFGKNGILLIEAGDGGRLSRITFDSPAFESAHVTTIKAGFPEGPVSVTVIGANAYVLEAQLSVLFGPNPGGKTKPFKATAVPVGKP